MRFWYQSVVADFGIIVFRFLDSGPKLQHRNPEKFIFGPTLWYHLLAPFCSTICWYQILEPSSWTNMWLAPFLRLHHVAGLIYAVRAWQLMMCKLIHDSTVWSASVSVWGEHHFCSWRKRQWRHQSFTQRVYASRSSRGVHSCSEFNVRISMENNSIKNQQTFVTV